MPHLYWLLSLHFIVDFPLQSDTLAREKSRYSTTALQKAVPWYYWLLSHACLHGVAVAVVTGSVWFGVAETVAHFIIDALKNERLFDIHTDQLLHVMCKVYWYFLLGGFN